MVHKMLPKISLFKCIFLLNLSTIQCFNIIMMKNLNENQVVDKLSELANQGKHENMVHKNVNSISVRSLNKRTSTETSSDENSSEEIVKEEMEKETYYKNENDKTEGLKGDGNVPLSNSTMIKHSKKKHKDAINTETSNEIKVKKPIKRTKKHKKDNSKDRENKKASGNEEEKSTFGRTIKTVWNTLRYWFRRNAGSRNDRVTNLIDDQNLIDVMKRIIVIMRASENSAKRPRPQEAEAPAALRNERSGEENDPLAPGKLPMNLMSLFTSTPPPKPMRFKPNKFWNFWTYPKEIHTDKCKGEGLIQYGNMCLESLSH